MTTRNIIMLLAVWTSVCLGIAFHRAVLPHQEPVARGEVIVGTAVEVTEVKPSVTETESKLNEFGLSLSNTASLSVRR